MENEDDKTSELNEPCWPFWGLLKNSSATVPFSSGHLHPNIGLHRAPSDIFERFESIVRKALRMLGRRTLQELRDSAAEIQLEIESSIDEYIRAQTKDLVDSLCKHGGYQLGYLPQGARGTEAEIKDLLDNWSSEWDDSSGLPQRDDLTDLEGLANYLEWNKYDEKTLVHCGLIEPEEHEHFAVLTLMIICDAIQKNPHPTYPNPESVARVKAIGHATISAIEAIGYADRIQFEEKIRKTVAAEQPTILAAEIETRIRDREIKAK